MSLVTRRRRTSPFIVSGLMALAVAVAPAGAFAQTASIGNGSADPENADATFTISMTPPLGAGTAVVTYTTADGTAAAGSDYTFSTGAVTFSAGEGSKTITIPTSADTLDEDNETFTVGITVVGATLGTTPGTGTIVDDDPEPSLSVADSSLTEGDAGPSNMSFTISLSPVSGRQVTVGYTTVAVSATAGADYTTTTGSVTFAAGETSKTVTVPVLGDTGDEPNETFTLQLSGQTNASLGDPTGTGTINDDDDPRVSINDQTVAEGVGSGLVQFTVSLSNTHGSAVRVDYDTSNGATPLPGGTQAAVAGQDYTSTSGTLTIPAGSPSGVISVPITSDTLYELSEVFTLTLTVPVGGNATFGDTHGTGDDTGVATITDDDPAPQVSVNDPAAVTEGNNPTNTSITFSVTLNTQAGRTVKVNYETQNGTAVAPGDYTALSVGTLTFVEGDTSESVTVTVIGDSMDEANETFTLHLSNADGTTALSDPDGIGTIDDDDPLPNLSIDDPSHTELNLPTSSDATFTVTVSPTSGRQVTVAWATAPVSATAGVDYLTRSGILTIAAGAGTGTILVPVTGDDVDEPNETFVVNLTSPSNAGISKSQGVGTILDDDAAPTLSIDDVGTLISALFQEGNFGTKQMSFTVTLSAASSSTVTVQYATSNGTATAGSDYVAKTGTLTFPAASLTQPLTVTINGDTVPEAVEDLNVTLSSPSSNASIGDGSGIGRITDDDGAPAASINNITVGEGDTGAFNAVFTVQLSTASGDPTPIVINYEVPGTGTPPPAEPVSNAQSGVDYTAVTGSLTFPAGTSSATFNVPILGDVLDEANETFLARISVGSGTVTVGDAWGRATINDNDLTPHVSVADATLVEGDSGTTSLLFSVSVHDASDVFVQSGQDITVDYTTVVGTAVDGGILIGESDYTATSGTLTIPALTASPVTIAVPVAGDATSEPDEDLTLVLSTPVNVNLDDFEGAGTISNDDPLPVLTIADLTLAEGPLGTTTNAAFTVSLTPPSAQVVRVSYASTQGGARPASDYTESAGRLTFAAGVTEQTFDVPVIGDATDELDERFFVDLTDPLNGTIGDPRAEGLITDDDALPAVSVADLTVIEGDAGATVAEFTVILSNPSDQTVTVSAATSDGTALQPSDYASSSVTLTFPVDPVTFETSVSQTVSVQITGDSLDEDDETLNLDLTAPINASIADAQAVATISDDDLPPGLSVTDMTVTEGDLGTPDITFVVTLSAVSGRDITVEYATADSTATAGQDYTGASGTLTFVTGDNAAKSIVIPVQDDNADETNERFFLNLSNAVNADLVNPQGRGTIDDDDPPPVLTVLDASVIEGDSGTVSLSFTAELSAPTFQPVIVNYATGAGTATEGIDYIAASGLLTFLPGETSRPILVTVTGDRLDEDDETVPLALTNIQYVTVGDADAVGTITDDDVQPTVSVEDLAVAEGDVGTTPAAFTLTLSAASGRAVVIDYATSDATATEPADYTARSGSVTFVIGSTSQTVAVDVLGDDLDEDDETFDLDVVAATNADVADPTGVATITDDDALPTLAIKDETVEEGDTGTVPAVFEVTVTPVAGRDIGVAYTTVNGTAKGGTEFTAVAGTLTIPAGVAGGVITVDVNSDLRDEADEIFTVVLSSPVNASLSDATAKGTILDDDAKGDFNADGQSDLLWRGPQGAHLAWLMEGAKRSESVFLRPMRPADPAFNLAALADFDGDGDSDMLWRHSSTGALLSWLMLGTERNSTVTPSPASAPSATATLALAMDLNRDEKTDLVWREANGTLTVWFMNGLVRTSSGVVSPGQSDTAFEPVAAGDFNGDAQEDILWQHQGDGRLQVWLMNGAVREDAPLALQPVTQVMDLDWRVRATGDYNGDGKADIVWQHLTTGQLQAWLMDGTSRIATVALIPGAVTGPGWNIVGPR